MRPFRRSNLVKRHDRDDVQGITIEYTAAEVPHLLRGVAERLLREAAHDGVNTSLLMLDCEMLVSTITLDFRHSPCRCGNCKVLQYKLLALVDDDTITQCILALRAYQHLLPLQKGGNQALEHLKRVLQTRAYIRTFGATRHSSR